MPDSHRLDRSARWFRWLMALALLLLTRPGSAAEDTPSPAPPVTPPATVAPTSSPIPGVPVVPDAPVVPSAPAVDAPAAPGTNAWRYIIIHHSASSAGNAAVFDRMHRAKGWDGVAYHFVITNGHGGPDGGLEVSPRWWKQKHGAHAGALPAGQDPEERNVYNEFGIGICLVGNFEKHAPTQRQLSTLVRLIVRLREKFSILPENIMGHRHVKSTACPGACFPWERVFALAGLPPPHLYRHAVSSTFERCPWCVQKGYVATAHHAAPPFAVPILPPAAVSSTPMTAPAAPAAVVPAAPPKPPAISIGISAAPAPDRPANGAASTDDTPGTAPPRARPMSSPATPTHR